MRGENITPYNRLPPPHCSLVQITVQSLLDRGKGIGFLKVFCESHAELPGVYGMMQIPEPCWRTADSKSL